MIIKPTNGRQVWYYPIESNPSMAGSGQTAQPLAATVCWVHDDHHVNVLVLDARGMGWQRENAYLVQPGEATPGGDYCAWMPYQQGQAKKAEEAEESLGARVSELEQWRGLMSTPSSPQPMSDSASAKVVPSSLAADTDGNLQSTPGG